MIMNHHTTEEIIKAADKIKSRFVTAEKLARDEELRVEVRMDKDHVYIVTYEIRRGGDKSPLLTNPTVLL